MSIKRNPRICLECGKPIILGTHAKTCSEKCRKDRLRKQKRALYEKHRGTEKFKDDRAAYLEALKAKRASDPELDAAAGAAHKAAVQKSVKKRNEDPGRREAQLKQMRDWKASASEEQKEKMRAVTREWYANLSPERKAELIAKKSEQRRRRTAQR